MTSKNDREIKPDFTSKNISKIGRLVPILCERNEEFFIIKLICNISTQMEEKTKWDYNKDKEYFCNIFLRLQIRLHFSCQDKTKT